MPIIFDWPAMERQAGESLEAVYKRLKSTRETGKFFGQFVGLKQGIGSDTISKELKRREVEREPLGGRNNIQSTKKEGNIAKIKALPGHEDMTREEIKARTGLTEGQFQNALRGRNKNEYNFTFKKERKNKK